MSCATILDESDAEKEASTTALLRRVEIVGDADAGDGDDSLSTRQCQESKRISVRRQDWRHGMDPIKPRGARASQRPWSMKKIETYKKNPGKPRQGTFS